MAKFLISEEMLSDLRRLYRLNATCPTTATPEILAKHKEVNDILDAGPLDMSDEAKFDAWLKNKQSGMEHRHGWVDCWNYLKRKINENKEG